VFALCEDGDPAAAEGRASSTEYFEAAGAEAKVLDEGVGFWGFACWVGGVAFPDDDVCVWGWGAGLGSVKRREEGANVPTLQCTNQLSFDRRTVPLMPIRQCCFVRVNKDVLGGSVCVYVVSSSQK
jgi:hypothetical protein